MRWERMAAVTVTVAFLFWYQWPRIKRNPGKDKAAFTILMLAGWILSLFDLPVITGPVTWINMLFKPFGKIMGE